MASFVANSACNGRKPRQLMGSAPFYRNELLARMMHDRSRVRYLLAPTGFGKSMLAGSYAQLMHEYRGVFWISGSNPCFLRDLDADTLADELLENTEEGGLVVFDDLPPMNRQRCRKAWTMCHRLLGAGREVVACSTPAANPFQPYLKSCIAVFPREFLYNDRDLEQMRGMDVGSRSMTVCQGPINRVPAIAGHAEGACERFLVAHIDEVEDAYQSGLTFAMLVLERGSIDDLSQAAGRPVSIADISADHLRPFVQVDEFRNEFDASGFPLAEVARPYAAHVRRISEVLGADNPNLLVLRLVHLLVQRQSTDRAVQLLVSLSLPTVRAAWLRESQDRLADAGSLVAAEKLFDSLRGTRHYKDWALVVGSGIRRCLLGYASDAAGDLLRVVHNSQAPVAVRLRAATAVLLLAGDDEVCKLVGAFQDQDLAGLPTEGESREFAELAAFWGSGILDACPQIDLDIPSSPLVLACYLRAVQLGMWKNAPLSELASAAQKVFDALQGMPEAELSAVLLRRAAQGVSKGLRGLQRPMRAVAPVLDAFEARLDVQSAVYVQMVRMQAAEAAASRSASFASEIAAGLPRTPLLYLTLFGQFGVRMGDIELDEASFSRGKVRVLLALLALDEGRDLSCDRLSDRMWPDSSTTRARHNFYCVLSLLRKALTLPGGECPYLRKTTGAICLEAGLTSSDASELELLCRKLRFDEPDPEAFLRCMEQVKLLYKGELLPGMDDEPLVVAARREWMGKIVGALVSAALRLSKVGEPLAALSLAQYALELDPSREDGYELVMGLQADCGQRPAAIDTWFDYCHYIDTHLGLAPAPRVQSLYDRIIGAKGPQTSLARA